MVVAIKGNRPSWWTLEAGMEVVYKGDKALCTSLGRNQGDETIVFIQIPTKNKAKRVRMKELSWE